MPDQPLMSIGEFARASGLTSSALRFYADSGLLLPSEVDAGSGYRYYAADQVQRATLLRRLRGTDMSLATVSGVLDADPAEAGRLIDEHVVAMADNARRAQRTAREIKAALSGSPSLPVAVLKGPVLASAVEQILAATAREPGHPILGGVRIEVDLSSATLTATDRYRLSMRSLVPTSTLADAWTATVDGDDLRLAIPDIRRSPSVRLEATERELWLSTDNRSDRHCRILQDEFPDYRQMLDSLGPAVQRITVDKQQFLRALEEHSGDRIRLRASGTELLTASGEHGSERTLPASVDGESVAIWFEMTTLYPAVDTAIGPDVMIDIRDTGQPVTIRSADRGDLSTVAMPIESGVS
ncbi:MerR family transcriptional regulator [Rhodococcus sp. NPDC058521]|uniref:DNA polymerase III subunit beta family protein n=1 Tax=Rhodococcus sp. NPDC058521 TaxID=3346536 RepID=UPI00364DEE24